MKYFKILTPIVNHTELNWLPIVSLAHLSDLCEKQYILREKQYEL